MRGKVLEAATIVDQFIADGRFDQPDSVVTLGQVAVAMPAKVGAGVGNASRCFP